MTLFLRIAPTTLRVAIAAVAIGTPPAVLAQAVRATPRIAYVYPAGARQGTTTRIFIGGQNLNGATATFFTGGGITARVVDYERPLAQRELNNLREELQKLQEKRVSARGKSPASAAAFSDADEKRMAEIRRKLAGPARRPPNPGLAETVTLEVTVDPSAAPGDHELRLKASAGLTNPFVFSVSQLPEFSDPVMTPTSPNAPRQRRDIDPRSAQSKPPTPVTLPTIINGQILPGEVDRFRFTARKDQRLTVVVAARALIPYLADAVPGWFQATVALFDRNGREVAYADDFRFDPDPVLSYVIAADGEYTLEIKDSIYRGREDFVYRVAIGELPFVTSIFPLGCAYPEKGSFQLSGWNLPSNQLVVDTRDKKPGTFVVGVRNQGQFSNRVRFAVGAQPETGEQEPNDTPEAAQTLVTPTTVNGRADRPGDQDVFKIQGQAGATIVAEVFARRLNSPLDSVLTLLDAKGGTVATNDDCEDKAAGLSTHHADSRISAVLPADGVYFVRVADTQHHAGPEYAYRLRVGPPHPDFELRVTPATINARSGMHVPITVYALRRDGFEGEILLGLRDAPRGFGLSGARIPAGQEKIDLTLWVGTPPTEEPIEFGIVGEATIDGRMVRHHAVPAEDMMQAFAYRHLVPAQRLLAQVTGRGSGCRLVSKAPVMIPAGGTVRVELSTPSVARGLDNIKVELSESPAGVTVQKASLRGETLTITLACDPAKAKPGTKGNLILHAAAERTGGASKNKKANRTQLATIPAVPFEIVGAALPGSFDVGRKTSRKS